MTQISIQRGSSANFNWNLGFDISGGTWEILSPAWDNLANPSLTTLIASAGTAKMRWTPAQTLDALPGKYKIRLRLNLPAGEALAFPEFTVQVL